MKTLLIAVMCFLLFECGSAAQEKTRQPADKVTYPLTIDSGKKVVYERGRMGKTGWEVYRDTVTLTAGQLYRRDTVRHPLAPFGLSYPEWKTIRCVIAIDERDYWGKEMIGLIERSGKLRISYNNKKIYLNPVGVLKIKEGSWSHTFKNDSMEMRISGEMKRGSILRCLTGTGKIVFNCEGRSFEEPVYFVYEKD